MKYIFILFIAVCSTAFSQKSDCDKYLPIPEDGSTIRTKKTCFLDRSQTVLNMTFFQKDSKSFLEVESNFKGVVKKIVLDTVIRIQFVFTDGSDYTIKFDQFENKEREGEHIYPYNTLVLTDELLDKLSSVAIEQVIIDNPYGVVQPDEKIVYSIPKGYQSRVTKIANCYKISLN